MGRATHTPDGLIAAGQIAEPARDAKKPAPIGADDPPRANDNLPAESAPDTDEVQP